MDRIDHVAVQVDDVDRALAWYTARFDCTVEYRDSTWAFVRFENMALALVLPGQHPPHIAVLTADAGADAVTHRDGTRSVYLTDADGNSVELLERPVDSL